MYPAFARKILINKTTLSIIIIMLLGLLSLTWFRGNFLIDNFDIDLPLNASQGIFRTLFTWDANSALGSYNPLIAASIVPFQLLWVSLNKLLPIIDAEKVLFYLLFTGSGISMFFLTLVVTKGRFREIIALISGVFYMLNPFSMTFIWPEFTTFIFLYSFLPLFLALFIKYLNGKGDFKTAFLTAFVLFLTESVAFQNPRFIVIAWIPPVLYVIFHILTTKKFLNSIKFTLLVFLSWLAMSAFYLLPIINYINANYGSLSYQAINISDVSSFILNSAPLSGLIRLSGYWALNGGYRGDLILSLGLRLFFNFVYCH